MILRLIDINGLNEDIPVSRTEPSLDKINKEIILFENYSYKIKVLDSDDIDNISLTIGDYSIPLVFNEATGCYETEKGLLFNGCFDLTYLTIWIHDQYGKEYELFTDFLRVASTKQTINQVEQMLEEIEENLPNFLNICFSHSRKTAGLINNNIRSVWNTLKLVDEVINVYEESYSFFSNHKKTSVEPISAVVDVKEMRYIGNDSLRWITCNPEVLLETSNKTTIEYDGKYFIPQKVKTSLSHYSFDVYENQIILGFIKTIILYLDQQVELFNRELREVENVPDSIIQRVPNTHDITGRCIYVYYKGVTNRFISRKESLEEIYYKYEKELNCVPQILSRVPKITNTFKQVFRYRLCYEYIIKWFESGDYAFNHINYLFKLKTLSRIFEYFCLIKMQKGLLRCGYSIKDTDRIIYDVDNEEEDINNVYVFEGNGYEITLLYEPFIWADKLNEKMSLYSTGYNFLKHKWSPVWKPDFVLKIKSEKNEYYYVLDAKYSNIRNVERRYINELVLKYGSQISSKDKHFSDVIGIGALYPDDGDILHTYRKNKVNSEKEPLPKYFSLAIIQGEFGDKKIAERLEELIYVIGEIEGEKRIKNIKKDEIKSNGTLQNEDSLHVEDVNERKHTASKGHSEIKVFGKKCLHYAKGLCLCRKERCDVVNSACEKYVSIGMGELERQNCDCRHLVQKKKGRKKGDLECRISGRSGCIGTEKCKFYVKIKK